MHSLLVITALLSVAPAQQRSMTFDTALKSVAVFRDGYGYYTRQGQVKLDNGWATTSFIPSAIRGTVWVYSLDKGDRIDTVITTRDNRLEFNGAGDIRAKLAEKLGARLSVVTHNGQRFDGELARLLDDMLLLQVGAAFSAVPYAQIRSISLTGYGVKVKVLTANPNKVANLGIAYMQEGIRWEPSYVLNVSGSKGLLELRASMQNTTESLSKSDVLFVVGSPFVANRGITDMIGVLPPNAVPAPAPEGDKKTESPRDIESAQAPPALKPTVSGEEAGELFFYKKQGLSLNTDETAMVSIFQEEVAVAPQFEWNADGEEVLYLLRIKNSTKQPLTTGPVFVVEDGKALGQETIKYTPNGATAEVRLARGIGLRVDKVEAEVKRGNTVSIGKSSFIPVTLRGTLTITNFRSSSTPLKITKTVRGKVTGQSDGGIVKETQVLSGEVNPINDLVWNVSIAAGETKTVTYSVETYIFADRSGTPPVPATAGEGQ